MTKETSADIVEENVLKGVVDFGVIPLSMFNQKKSRLINYEIISSEQLILVAQKGFVKNEHILKDDIIDLKTLDTVPFILLNKGRAIRSAIDNIFKQFKFKPTSLMETSSNATAYRLATTGAGVAIVPSYILMLYRGMEAFDVYRLSEEGYHWDVAFIYQQNADDSDMRDNLIELFRTQFAKGLD